MNVNLYRANDDNNIITFSMLHTINSINIFVFQIRSPPSTTTTEPIITRLVSGYEKGLRNISMKMTCVSSPIMDRNAYIVSCVRAPCVLLKLMASKKFSRPVAPVMVQCNGETQVWHVFSVAKGKELNSMTRIRGVTVWLDGAETYIDKELIYLTGNLPSAFLSSLSKNTPNVDDVDTLKLVFPSLCINAEDVIVECVR